MPSLKQMLKAWQKSLYWKGFDLLHQKNFRSEGYTVHYVHQKEKSDVLLVVFSAYAAGLKPTYNYVRTLWGKGYGQLLFIRDDFVNLPSGGAYYLGKQGDYNGKKAVLGLIEKIRRESGVKTVIGIGSSKGGTAALMFGAMAGFDALILGGCQYYIGKYMQEHKMDSLRLLTGMENPDEREIVRLDAIVPQAVRQAEKKPEIYLHYSDREHTYPEHLKDMIRDLKEAGYSLTEDVADYETHSEIYRYYVPYLEKTLKILLKKYGGMA